MIPWSWRWESMRFFFVERSCVPSIFFWDHLFEGFLCLVHGLLSQLRCCRSFAEYCIGHFFLLLVYFFPLFFRCNNRCLCIFWLDARYYYWLTLLIQGRVLPMNNGFESRQPGVAQDYFVSP